MKDHIFYFYIKMCYEKGKLVTLVIMSIFTFLIFLASVTLTGVSYHYYKEDYNSTQATVINYFYLRESCSDCFLCYGSYVGYIIFDYETWSNYSEKFNGTERVSCSNSSASVLSKAKYEYPLNSTFNIYYNIDNPIFWIRHSYIFSYLAITAGCFILFLLSLGLIICYQSHRQDKYNMIN